MANTFGLIVSGRLVQTNFEQVEANKFLITIPNADSINHVVVFLTGQCLLPEGLASAVYFSFPNPSLPPSWIYLGYISNDKPSAIFKINKLKQMSTANNNESGLATFAFSQPVVSHLAQIGISVEPKSSIDQLCADPSSSSTDMGTKFEQFATKMAENLFNYCSSFSSTLKILATNPGANPNQQLVPLTSINDWYNRFIRNFKQNPNFWNQ